MEGGRESAQEAPLVGFTWWCTGQTSRRSDNEPPFQSTVPVLLKVNLLEGQGKSEKRDLLPQMHMLTLFISVFKENISILPCLSNL